MPEKCVVLDIGGVLEITPSTGWPERWERRLGLPQGRIEALMGATWAAGETGALTEREIRDRTASVLHLDEERLRAFMTDLWTAYLGTANTELLDHVRALTLRSRCRVGLLSNSFVGAREREERRYGFSELAELTVYSHETGILKPDPRAYALACDRLGVTPEACLFVDDDPANVEAARAQGMRGHLYEDNAGTIAAVEHHLAHVTPRTFTTEAAGPA